jgi:hypothetical protein
MTLLDILEILAFLPIGHRTPRERRRKEGWTGRVEKKVSRKRFLSKKRSFAVVFRTEKGKKRVYEMGKENYDVYELNRTYLKIEGNELPEQKPLY